MNDYEVMWIIETSGETPEDAAKWVNDTFLQKCEDGDWTYEVIDRATGVKTLVTVPDDGEYEL